MVKSKWGLKRTCQSCATRFYDLGKDHIACPKCGAEFDPEAILKTKRGKPAAKAVPVPAKVVEAEVEADDLVIEDDAVDGDKDDDEVIEDTSELGEDTEDVAEVIENVEGEEER